MSEREGAHGSVTTKTRIIHISISIFKTGVDIGTHISSRQRRVFKIRFLRFIHSPSINLKYSFSASKEMKKNG